MKDYFKKYSLIIYILLAIVILVSIRLLFTDHFKNGAEQNALPALSYSNVMQASNPKFLAANSLIVYIDEPEQRFAMHANVIEVNSDEILNKTTLKDIKQSERTILVSDDPSLTARCWMLLAQKGVINLFVYSTGGDEDFKHEFQRDTTIRSGELE
ncbi:MAG: hypothetical protein ACERKD_01820 [Prolixibacteraceae bacterium]